VLIFLAAADGEMGEKEEEEDADVDTQETPAPARARTRERGDVCGVAAVRVSGGGV
jgi:hypothetical protein